MQGTEVGAAPVVAKVSLEDFKKNPEPFMHEVFGPSRMFVVCPDEESFVEEGLGVYRHDLMYNDFVFVGPNKYLNSKVRPDSLPLFLKKISSINKSP